MSQSTNWCYTIYHTTKTVEGKWDTDTPIQEVADHETILTAHFGLMGDELRGWMGQLERCPNTGKLHYQCFFILKKKKSMNPFLTGLYASSGNLAIMKGKVKQCEIYCGKEDSRVEGPWKWGQLPENAGKREDLESLKEAIRGGASKRQLLEEHSIAYAKYPRFVEQYTELHSGRQIAKIENWVLRPWQQYIWNLLSAEPNPRHINWIYDVEGNRGKTWMARLLGQEMSVFYCNGGKHADLLYAYRGEPIVIFDYVRESKEYVAYGVMEQLKNGSYFSPKYQSEVRHYKVPHVIVFANFEMEKGKFSADREQSYYFIGQEMWLKNGDISNKIC